MVGMVEMSMFSERIVWRVPASASKWRGKAEVVMKVVTVPGRRDPPKIDIRVQRTAEHPKGEGFTREGVRLDLEDVASLVKALQHTLRELEGSDATG